MFTPLELMALLPVQSFKINPPGQPNTNTHPDTHIYTSYELLKEKSLKKINEMYPIAVGTTTVCVCARVPAFSFPVCVGEEL